MKCEDISDAMGLLDESMIAHALVVRGKKEKNRFRKRVNQSKIWRTQYIAAACFCLICVSAAAVAVWLISRSKPENNLPQESGSFLSQNNSQNHLPQEDDSFLSQYNPENNLPSEDDSFNGQVAQGDLESEGQEVFVNISSLLASNNSGLITVQAEKRTFLPIEEYRGIYREVSSCGSSVLAESIGKRFNGIGDIGNAGDIDSVGGIGSAEEWYYISGHSDRQYLIHNDGQEFSLWKFQCFDSSEYPYNDVLKLIYQIDSADAITEIEVMPARMDNTDEGKRIQEKIGTRKITEKAAIEAMYEVLSSMTCYGSGRWDLIDYGNAEASSDGGMQSHEAVWLGRYLSIITDYGNAIDGLKYTAVSDMFYEFSGIAYSPLTEEQAAGICEILGITESGEGSVLGTNEPETDSSYHQENKPDDAEKSFLVQATNLNASLEYVTELQNKVSNAMINHELPFVIKSAVYENPYRLHIVVTTDAEEDLQKLLELDSAGGVLEIEYSAENINFLQDLQERK